MTTSRRTTTINFPVELYDELKPIAERNRRTVSAEVAYRISRSFTPEDTAIIHASKRPE